MERKKRIGKFNIVFIILLVLTVTTTTYAWILNIEPIIAPLIEYKQEMKISPTYIQATLKYSRDGTEELVNNEIGQPLFKLGKMIPGKMYNFYLYVWNTGDTDSNISIYLDGIHVEANAHGVSIKDKMWFRVQMVEGYDTTQLPPTPDFIMLDDQERLTSRQTANLYDYILVKSATISPKATSGEAKFLISVMLDPSADSTYEESTLTIENIRIDE